MKSELERTFFIETYGCAANRSDSERILRILKGKNFQEVNSVDQAKIAIFNTCGVKNPTEKKILKILKQLESEKQIITLITGCLPSISLQAIKEAHPSFGAIVDTKSTHKIGQVIDNLFKNQRNIELFTNQKATVHEKINILPLNINPQIGILTINEGCDGNCTFCGTKLARGKTLSYAPEKLLEQTRIMIQNGASEIWITSQDSGAYYYEENGKIWQLPELLQAICKLPLRFRVRIGMINPEHILELEYNRTDNKLFDIIESNSQIYHFLHIPIQSGNDRILELMKRRYSTTDFKNIIKNIRERFPLMTISTDVIAGFPTETKNDFNDTIDLIKWLRPNLINISRFGPRPGTVAEQMDGQIHQRISKERSSLLLRIWEKIALEENKKWEGWKGQVLIDEEGIRNDFKNKKTIIARNFAYKQIILPANVGSLGEFVSVKITKAKIHYFYGSENKPEFPILENW